MIDVKLIGHKALIQRLKRAQTVFGDELVNAMNRELISLRNYVVADKLTGQVLHVRTGLLRNSINWRLEARGNNVLIGTVGTNVLYAHIHEFGGVIVPRNAPFLVFQLESGQWIRTKKVIMPERSFLRSALADRRDQIVQNLKNACRKAIIRTNNGT